MSIFAKEDMTWSSVYISSVELACLRVNYCSMKNRKYYNFFSLSVTPELKTKVLLVSSQISYYSREEGKEMGLRRVPV